MIRKSFAEHSNTLFSSKGFKSNIGTRYQLFLKPVSRHKIYGSFAHSLCFLVIYHFLGSYKYNCELCSMNLFVINYLRETSLLKLRLNFIYLIIVKSPAGNYYHCWIESWMTIIRWLTKKEKITQSKQTNKQTNVLSQFRSSIIDENEIVVLSFNWWGIKEFNHPVQKVKQTLILALFIWRILPWVKGSPPPPPILFQLSHLKRAFV